MRLHANNMFHRDVRVFSAATVFVDGASELAAAGLRYEYKRDSLSESARSVSVPLRHLVARTLTVRLEFDARWIMISEIQFSSGKSLHQTLISVSFVGA